LKQRLPVVSSEPLARAFEARRSASRPSTRVAVSRPLVCVASGPDAPRAVQFACGLIAALRARGRAVAVLLAAESNGRRDSAVEQLEAAGAQRVLLLSVDDLPHAAIRALSALPLETVAVALGEALAAQLAALLTVSVSAGVEAHARKVTLEDPVDLRLGVELGGVATMIGDWLAGRTMPSYASPELPVSTRIRVP
jgi:hypothetical protein